MDFIDKQKKLLFRIAFWAIVVSVLIITVSTYFSKDNPPETFNLEEILIESISKEYVELLVIIKSIAIKFMENGNADFSNEMNSLRRIQDSPSFYIFLNSIDDEDRKCLEEGLQKLSNDISIGYSNDSIHKDSIYENLENITIVLYRNSDLKRINFKKFFPDEVFH